MTRKPNFWKCILGVTVLALLFVGTLAMTTTPRSTAQDKNQSQGAQAPLAPSPTPTPGPQPQSVKNVFEAFDGDAANDPNVAGEDWNTINPTTNPPPGGANEDPPFGNALIRTFVYDPDVDTDFIFTGGGTKDFNNLNQWGNVQRGTGPDKDDVEHAFAAKYIDNTQGGTGNTILVFGGDRPTSNGDANIGFWFFQKAVFVGPNGNFVDENGNPASHQDGDIFVLSAFTGGGGTSTIRVLKWISSAGQCTAGGAFIDAASNGHLCDITGTATSVGSGATNKPICADPNKTCPSQGNPDLGISVVWPYQNKDNKTDCPGGGQLCKIPSPDFFEGAIDLTALGLQNECFSSFMLETRSSASVSAVLKDFALGKFESCSGTCDKTVNLGSVCQGTPSTFTYSTTNTGGAALGQTLKDDNATPGDSSDDFYITGKDGNGVCTIGASPVTINVAAGQTFSCTRTVTLGVGTHTDTLTVHTVTPFPGAVGDCTKSATVTVNPNPAANPASLALCETTNGGGQATFNLTTTESTVTGGAQGVTVSWFSDQALTQSIATPGAYTTGSTTVYAKVTSAAGCSSSAPVALTVNPNPAANTASLELCETTTGGGTATFNLTSVNSTVTGGAQGVTVNWFSNQALTTLINNPAAFTSGSTTVYARVTNNTTSCFNSAAVTLTVNKNPVVTINNFACTLGGSALLTATVTSGTGTGPFTYTWTKTGQQGTITPPDPNHPETISVSAIGEYKVDVVDSKGCIAAQAKRTVGLCTTCSP